MTLDPATRAVLEVIHQAGYTTTVVRLDGIYHVTAIDPAGERWRVSGDDPYRVTCELAVQPSRRRVRCDGSHKVGKWGIL